jgi:hypothetical protein
MSNLKDGFVVFFLRRWERFLVRRRGWHPARPRRQSTRTLAVRAMNLNTNQNARLMPGISRSISNREEPHRWTAPITASTEVSMGEPVTVCVMGLHDWIYVQKKNPNSLPLSIGAHLLNLAPSVIGRSDQEYLTFMSHRPALQPTGRADGRRVNARASILGGGGEPCGGQWHA